ncbi:bifunctional methylenetetrahydrofolate dehydrogenase/methenyltetrahydrofolate cyclohydrolase FolD [Caulifigura coniformis]|uniref:bifunctional methylenetetrahydrofolate dehydrogenase/methenyltetrahydrofolate cyclohydrolase FolD n=1 Tax=Caulifigura coniformis TaxID=2527983 RepID=UPI0011A0735E|nr:bifunctional methylenetetrahydrofolate dehydrogenase/methenyltetrahydrofolate cyclohydrolase FolD [Caulifigura coniformis]
MAARIIDGKAVSQKLRTELADEVAAFKQQTGVIPHLAVVLVGDDPASAVYVRSKSKGCEQAGMAGSQMTLPADTSQAQLLELVARLNADPQVHGILVQLPLPRQIDETVILDAIDPLKDVDGFHASNVGLLAQGRPRFVPCTPLGCQKLLLDAGIPTSGAHAVVIGRSEIVGKPMASLLVQKGAGGDATVTICHSRTKDLAAVVRTADIVVAAIGRPKFVTADMIKPGATVIDVGINRIETGLVGDVDYGPVSEIAGAITPVPGGVGPMTIAMLLANTLLAAKLQTQARR